MTLDVSERLSAYLDASIADSGESLLPVTQQDVADALVEIERLRAVLTGIRNLRSEHRWLAKQMAREALERKP